jgi:hypothetical protein
MLCTPLARLFDTACFLFTIRSTFFILSKAHLYPKRAFVPNLKWPSAIS